MAETLDKVRPGASAVITGIRDACSEQLGERLQALGFTEGKTVNVVRNAPLGDPVIYRVCDQVLCLRKREAAMLEVELSQLAA